MDMNSTLSTSVEGLGLDDTGAQVLLTARAFARLAEQRLRPLGLGVAHVPVLLALSREGPLTVGGLAQRTRVEQPTATALVRRMEAAGLVERGPDPGDRRSTRVRLSARGEDAVTQALERRRRAVTAATADLTEAEVEALDALLRRVREAVDRALASDPDGQSGADAPGATGTHELS